MLGGAASPGGDELLTVTVVRDEHGYGMKVSGDNPVYVQSVKEHGAAWRAGLRAGDRILRVDNVPVQHHSHQQVVHLIRANPSTVLTVQQNTTRLKTPITAPVPANLEKQRQFEASKVKTMRLMLDKEQKYIRDLRNELLKVPDVRKQAELESAEQRCTTLQHEIDLMMSGQPERSERPLERSTVNTGFLSGLPRSLSNLTGQSLRHLRAARREAPPLVRQQSDERSEPTTCLDQAPPPLPPRAPRPLSDAPEGPQPNSIALQMSYPLVNVPPPPLQTDSRPGVPFLHVRSRSSPEQFDNDLNRSSTFDPTVAGAVSSPARGCSSLGHVTNKSINNVGAVGAGEGEGEWAPRATPPGTPPPPYHTNTLPCPDPQRAIISMEEDDSPASDNSTYSGLFSNLRSVRDSKARTAVLLNWLLAERRSGAACLLLILTDAYRSAAGVTNNTLRRWAYEIHSTFTMPHAVLRLSGVDENMANEIEHVLVNEFDKEELLRNVFRKARQKAKEELAEQLAEFQVKRQLGLARLYGPSDSVLERCAAERAHEQTVVEKVVCGALKRLADQHQQHMVIAALAAAALHLHCRPASVAAALGGQRACFLQRDKLYKQRLKQIAKQNPQPFVVRGHHLVPLALTSVAHCHRCDHLIAGLAPQAYICNECKLRVHRECARGVEESCCVDADHHNNRISRFMERIHAPPQLQDSMEKKSRKASGTTHFLNMERSFRKMEDEPPVESLNASTIERRDESDESLYESADCHSDNKSISDDALPQICKPTIHTDLVVSKESLKNDITDEEVETKFKKGHRKAVSLSNPLEIVKTLGEDWLDLKSKESLWSEEDRDSIHGSTNFLDQIRKNSRKEDKSQSNSRKSSNTDTPKTRKSSKGSSVSALNFLRRKKNSTTAKPVEVVTENTSFLTTDQMLNLTRLFLEREQRHSSIEAKKAESDSEEEAPAPKQISEHRRRLSRQTSRSKSKVRGKSQSLKVNTLRKSHSGTLKKGKKKSIKGTPLNRSRQTSIVEHTPKLNKKHSESMKQANNYWLFSGPRGETKREGSNEEPSAPDADVDTSDANTKEPEKENSWRVPLSGNRGVNRAESCRERDAPRRGKHRNASDPNRLTAHNNHDLEPGAATAPSGSSSSSSLSSRSNESNTVQAEQQASQSDLSDEEDPLPTQWVDSIPPQVLATLSARERKRQEVIHELIVSEGSHVRWLRVLGRVFLRPLSAVPTLLPGAELRALLPNLPAVREKHVRFYTALRELRATAGATPVVARQVAQLVVATLGETGYAPCLATFCRGQRRALDALKDRRRKHKDLHQFLLQREQSPLCSRLQLHDLLACVWQRLTKYQLLLEGIIKTMSEDEEDYEQDMAHLTKALNVAKEVLHTVDTAIRTDENEHRLRTIQSKLEVRSGGGSEWEELRRIELTGRSLTHEGELAIRHDANKKIHLLALMLEDCLVLLQREGDKFILKPIPQPSQQQPLSPLIKWDKVLFRPNAAVRNTFFLMNINGVQMHELSATSASEYATWVKHIQSAPLARLSELKPSHSVQRSTDDSGINVSRNPSDASEKSNSIMEDTNMECERERASAERSSSERERDGNMVEERNDRQSVERQSVERQSVEKEEKEEKHRVRRPTVGRISTHSGSVGALEPPTAVRVTPPPHSVHTAVTALADHERLRRLDEIITRALIAKSVVVSNMLGVPPQHRHQVEELAVADSLGLVEGVGGCESEAEVCQLVLAAVAQARALTHEVRRAMSVHAAPQAVAARRPHRHTRAELCDHCADKHDANQLPLAPVPPLTPSTLTSSATLISSANLSSASVSPSAPPLESTEPFEELPSCDQLSHSLDDVSYDMMEDIDNTCDEEQYEHDLVTASSAAVLGARLAPLAAGVQRALTALATSLPAARLHAHLHAERQHRHTAHTQRQQNETAELLLAGMDPVEQDEPSNGG